MTIVVRAIQTVAIGKMDEKTNLEKRCHAVETRLGAAAPRHYRCRFGASSAYVKEWEFEDSVATQELSTRLGTDAEWKALGAEDEERGITIDQWNELYARLI